MMRYALAALALLSPFLFPYPATLAFSFAASVFLPPVGLLAGLLTDVLYYTPGASGWPIAVIAGLFISIIGFFVRRFLKTRIIGG